MLRKWLVIGGSLVVLATLACGFAADEPTRVPATPTATPPVGAATVNSSIANFTLQDVEIKTNTVVEWVNDDKTLHTVTHSPTETGVTNLWDSGRLQAGAAFTFHFTEPGVFNYTCLVHPVNMRGVITVTE